MDNRLLTDEEMIMNNRRGRSQTADGGENLPELVVTPIDPRHAIEEALKLRDKEWIEEIEKQQIQLNKWVKESKSKLMQTAYSLAIIELGNLKSTMEKK